MRSVEKPSPAPDGGNAASPARGGEMRPSYRQLMGNGARRRGWHLPVGWRTSHPCVHQEDAEHPPIEIRQREDRQPASVNAELAAMNLE